MRLIESSVLLSEDRKSALREIIRNLDEHQTTELKSLLLSEDALLKEIAERAIRKAIEEGDEAFLQELETLLSSAGKKLHKLKEAGDKNEEAKHMEHFFDTAS